MYGQRPSRHNVHSCSLFDSLCYSQIDLINAHLNTGINGHQLSNLGIEIDIRLIPVSFRL